MLQLLLLAVVIGVASYHWFFKKPRKGLPPKVGPGIWATISKMTTISDLTQIHFVHDLSLLLTGAGKGTTNGAVFRLNMPQLHPFIVATDYKLIRRVLEGSSKDKIPEAEKPAMLRSFDYASTASLLT